jgi:GNAT superfamily N-acetyltransferase
MKAKKNEGKASRTFVICKERSVVGYYTLALGSLYHCEAMGKLKRNMPDPIPAMILGRLAMDTKFQNRGLGSALLKDAIQRTLIVCKHAGTRALIVHALNHKAKEFYIHHGFKESPTGESTLMLPIEEITYNL